MLTWTENLKNATHDLGSTGAWDVEAVDDTRLSLAADVRQRAREIVRAMPPVGSTLTPLQNEYVNMLRSRCMDFVLAKHPTVASWLAAYREA